MALIAYSMLLVFGVGMRIVLHYRRTGDSGLRTVKGSSTPAAKVSMVLLLLSVAGTFTLTLLDAVDRLPAVWSLGWPARLVGTGLCLLGIFGTILSQHQMGAAWRLGVDESERTELVVRGLYDYTRNPIYSAVMLFGLGLGLLIPHPLMLLFLLVGVLGIDLHVRRVEEPHLLHLHGEAFERYRQRVNRYLPWIANR